MARSVASFLFFLLFFFSFSFAVSAGEQHDEHTASPAELHDAVKAAQDTLEKYDEHQSREIHKNEPEIVKEHVKENEHKEKVQEKQGEEISKEQLKENEHKAKVEENHGKVEAPKELSKEDLMKAGEEAHKEFGEKSLKEDLKGNELHHEIKESPKEHKTVDHADEHFVDVVKEARSDHHETVLKDAAGEAAVKNIGNVPKSGGGEDSHVGKVPDVVAHAKLMAEIHKEKMKSIYDKASKQAANSIGKAQAPKEMIPKVGGNPVGKDKISEIEANIYHAKLMAEIHREKMKDMHEKVINQAGKGNPKAPKMRLPHEEIAGVHEKPKDHGNAAAHEKAAHAHMMEMKRHQVEIHEKARMAKQFGERNQAAVAGIRNDIEDRLRAFRVHMDNPDLTDEDRRIGMKALSEGRDSVMLDHHGHKHLLVLGPEPSGFVFLCLFLFMITLQMGIFYWKKHHARKFQRVTLVGLAVIPPIIAISGHFVRFLLIWILFVFATSYVMFRATRKPLEASVPKLVYNWFNNVHRICYAMAVAGYVVFMLDLVGLALLLPFTVDLGIMMLFYGLYFGVLGRDFAEAVTETLANNIGFISSREDDMPQRSISSNDCVLCFEKLNVVARPGEAAQVQEKICKLTCNHSFHESCIRGWLVVGKKDTCPSCKERQNLRQTFTNSWEVTTLAWGQVLDAVRYLVVWNPVLLLMSQIVLYFVVPPMKPGQVSIHA